MRVDDGAVEGVARGQHGVEARPVHPQQDGTQQRKQVRAALESGVVHLECTYVAGARKAGKGM